MNFEKFLTDECNYKDVRFINEGKNYIAIAPYIFTHAIIRGATGDVCGFDDRWCYHSYQDAKKAIDNWDGIGEPDGWHREPSTGRRRPDGDKEKEYINF